MKDKDKIMNWRIGVIYIYSSRIPPPYKQHSGHTNKRTPTKKEFQDIFQ